MGNISSIHGAEDLDAMIARNIEIDIAALGQEAQVFQKSNLYRYIQERADLQRDANIAQLIATDPQEVQACTRYRNDIQVAEMFKAWIDEAINSGSLAIGNLRKMDAEVND